MRALVTGGAGFIGSNVVKLLVQRSHTVRVLDNFSLGCIENLEGLEVEFFKGDVCDAELVEAAVRGSEVVFHLAASVGNIRSIECPVVDSEVNVLGTLRVLEAARRHGVSKVIYSSSSAIFGDPNYLPIDEAHPTNPSSPYGVSKLAAEKHCLCYAKLYGITAICLRYFNVYGVSQRYDAYGNVIPIFALRLLKQQPLKIYGDGEQTRDFVDVRDVARANVLSMERNVPSGCYNIGSGTATTINSLAEVIQNLSGVKTPVKHAEPRKAEVRHSVSRIDAARVALSYSPEIPLDQGLSNYLEWLRLLNNGN